MICKRPGCGSQAINIERDKLEKGKTVFCDVCHWRDKTERLEREVERLSSAGSDKISNRYTQVR